MTDWQSWNEHTIKTTTKAWENGFLKPLMEFFPELLGKTILDLGCGNGEILTKIAQHKAKIVWGLDLDKQALENCKMLAEVFKLKNVFLKKGNAEKIPFNKNSFDVVYSIGLLEHFKNPQKLLLEAKRVLKPGGILIVAVPNGECLWRELKLFVKPTGIWEKKYSQASLARLLFDYGFKKLEVKYLNYSPILLRIPWWLIGKGTK